MKLNILAGATSQIFQIFIADSSSTTGAGLTGLTNASSGLTAYYHRDTDTTATAISIVTMTVGTFTSSGFKEIDATNMPGWYQFCPPNAALAASAKSCAFHLKGVTNMAPLPIEVQLTAYDPNDAVRLGLTALPNATAGASGGLHINGSNSGTTTLAALTITGSMTLSDGLLISRSTSNASAITATGNGTGHGAVFTSGSGATGDGVQMTSVSTNGNGATLQGKGTGPGFITTGGLTGNGLKVVGGGTSGDAILTSTTSGHGATFAGTGTTKHGINATGGATSSDGIRATGGGTGNGLNAQGGGSSGGSGIVATANAAGNGLVVTGNGSGNGLQIVGGSTASGMKVTGGASGTAGLEIVGGAASGDGIKINAQVLGHGINIIANGLSKHGIVSNGATTTTTDAGGHGLALIGGASSTSSGGTAGVGLSVLGGAGSASTNGSGNGATFAAGGTTTVSAGFGVSSDILTQAMTESYSADGATMSAIQGIYLTTQILGESSISGTTRTVKKVDGSTTAATYTLDSGTSPTSITRAT